MKKSFGKKSGGGRGGFGEKKRSFGDRGPRREGDTGGRSGSPSGFGRGGSRHGDAEGRKTDGFRKRRHEERGPPERSGFGGKKRSFGDRGPRREGDTGGRGGFGEKKRSFGDRGPRREGDTGGRGGFGEKKRSFGDRGPRREGDTGGRGAPDDKGRSFRGHDGRDDFRGPRREFRERFGDRDRGAAPSRGTAPDRDPPRKPRFTPPRGPGRWVADHEQAARVADRPESQRAERRHLQNDEARFLGANACRTLWERRPQDIIRVYVRTDLQDAWKEMLDWCARERKPYHLVEDRDLEKLTDSVHHQGVCVVARRKEPTSFFHAEKELRFGQAVSPILVIDGVENPHNVGAILRTAGYLGVRWVIGRRGSLPRLSPAALRTAEGGAEFCDLVESEDIVKDIEALKKLGYTIYSTSVRPGAVSAFETRFDPRAVIVLGAEVTGVSPEVQALADRTLHIPGSGGVESLNVAASAAILCAEAIRQHGSPRTKLVRPGK